MGLIDWLLRREQKREPERRSLSLEHFTALGLADAPTAAGVPVNEKTALTLAAYWCGVNLIASAIGKLPRKVYRKLSDDTREEAAGHAVGWIVQGEPNPFVVPLVFWRTMIGHVLTWGNGFAEIERDRANRPIGLWTIAPDRIEPQVEISGGAPRLWYRYNGAVRLEAEDVFHVPGLGFDGLRGYSVVQMARQSLGLAMASERYSAQFFGEGAFPGVVLETDKTLTSPASDRLVAAWDALHKTRKHRTAVLEEGMKAHVLSVPAKDAQLIESRELQVLDVARWLNLNPAMIGYKTAERPGGNYESSRLDFLDNTLDSWLVAIEQECNRKLLSEAQRGVYYIEHVRSAVLRTDAKTRSDVQKTYVEMGVLSPEAVARLENLPKPDAKEMPLADKVEAVGQLVRAGFDPEESAEAMGLPKIKHTGLVPVTVQGDPADDPDPAPAPAPPAGDPAPEPEPDDDAQRAAWRRVAVDVLARLTKIEAERARRAAARGAEKFGVWVAEFYPGHEVRLREALEPVVRGWCETRGRTDWQAALEALASGLVSSSREELLGAKAGALEADVDARVGRWERERPSEVADRILEAA